MRVFQFDLSAEQADAFPPNCVVKVDNINITLPVSTVSIVVKARLKIFLSTKVMFRILFQQINPMQNKKDFLVRLI